MGVEFIGMIGTQHYSEIYPPRGPAIDINYVRDFAQAHEQADFDRILIGYFTNAADGFIVASDAAIAIAGKHADVYALWGEPLAEAQKTIARVRTSAAAHGRTVRFSLSTRPILASTEDAAWARAKNIIDTIQTTRGR